MYPIIYAGLVPVFAGLFVALFTVKYPRWFFAFDCYWRALRFRILFVDSLLSFFDIGSLLLKTSLLS